MIRPVNKTNHFRERIFNMTEATQGVITGENTISKMVKAKIIQARQTGLFIQVKDIHDKLRADGTNWNSRSMASEETKANIDGILAHIQAGGQLPPIEVQPRAEGGVQKVDGYCRHEAHKLADAGGLGELWVPIVPFLGTELQALARIVTSGKGTRINPLETLDNYNRIREMLIAEGNAKPSLQDVADVVQVTRQYVDAIFKLNALDDAGKALVAEGKVTVAVAVKAVRANPEDATALLEEAAKNAEKLGKKTATAGTEKKSKPFELGKPLLLDIHQIGMDIRESIHKDAAAAAEEYLRGDRQGTDLVQLPVRGLALLLAALREGERQAEDAAKSADAKSQKSKQTDIEHVAIVPEPARTDVEGEALTARRADILDDQEAEEAHGHADESPIDDAPEAEPEFPDTDEENTFSFLG